MSKKINKKTVILDKKKCIGCASCVVLCPEVFSLNEKDTIAVVNERAVENTDFYKIESTIQACPTSALSIKD